MESRLKTSQSELLKTNKKFEEMKEESNSTLTDNDDGKVPRVGESNKMKDVEDSFKDKYSKLIPLAIKLKKKIVDLERVIKELQSKNSKAVKNANDDSNNFKTKMTHLTKNFNSLQNQYDATVDKLENVEAGAKTLRKDLEASVSKYLASRQKN